MKIIAGVLFFVLLHFVSHAQYALNTAYATPYSIHSQHYKSYSITKVPAAQLYQRNRGVIVGLQRGNITSIELGGEAHWRKISLRKPNIYGATVNMEYNIGNNVIGYKAGMWMKHGRINLTYGGNVAYYNDFEGHSRYGIGPAVGFRLLGFHLINGYNFLAGDKTFDKVNPLYVTLRYYFPVENKFVWDKKGQKKKIKEKEKKKKAKVKAKNKKFKEKEKAKKLKEKGNGEKPKLFGIL